MKRKDVLLSFGTAVMLAGAALAAWQWMGRHHLSTSLPPAPTVGLALAMQAPSALAILAAEKGFFEREGVRVTVKEYVSGNRALSGLFAGEAEAATVADVAVVFASFDRGDFRIVCSVATADNDPSIVARRDAGIGAPGDLKGKRVATQRASAVHFFLHCFLLKHGMSEDDISLSFMKVEDMPSALQRGELDAFCLREPYVSEAVAALKTNAVVFQEPGLYLRKELLVVTQSLLDRQPDTVRRMLLALTVAARFAKDNRAAAIEIVARKLHITPRDMRGMWDGMDLDVTLDQALLPILEDEARWAIKNGLTERKAVTNYLDLIYTGGLEAARPNGVSLIR